MTRQGPEQGLQQTNSPGEEGDQPPQDPTGSSPGGLEVSELADRVYQLLLQDLVLDRERGALGSYLRS